MKATWRRGWRLGLYPPNPDAAHVLADVVPELEYELEFGRAQVGKRAYVSDGIQSWARSSSLGVPIGNSPGHPASRTLHPTRPAHQRPSDHKPDRPLPQPRLLRDRAARIAWLLPLVASPLLGFVVGALVPVRIRGRGDGSPGMVGTNDCALAGAIGAPVALVPQGRSIGARVGCAALVARQAERASNRATGVDVDVDASEALEKTGPRIGRLLIADPGCSSPGSGPWQEILYL